MALQATYLPKRKSILKLVKKNALAEVEQHIVLTEEQKEVAAAKESRENFAPLYERYYEQIFRYVNKRVYDKDTCFDLCSQVFLKAMTKLDTYVDKGFPFSSWLYRIAYTTIIDFFREEKNETERTIDIKSEDIERIADEIEIRIPEETYEALFTSLEGLKEEDLQLVEMRFFEKRPFKEVAEILNITENNAKVKVYRVLDKLKTKLHSHA